MTTAYEQYCACTTLEELAEVKPLLEAERDAATAMHGEYIKKMKEYQALAGEQRQMIHNVPALIKEKGYEISFPDTEG